MYENRTAEDLREEKLAALPPDIDTREGELAYDMSMVNALSEESLYIEMDTVLALGFAQTSVGEWLEKRVGELGITRKQAEKAGGEVTFSYGSSATIPAGERLVADDADGQPVFFVTLAEAVLNAGTAKVAVEAEEGGTAGNVGAGAISSFAEGSDFFGVVTVTNEVPLTGGVDIESDESLLDRYMARASKPSTSGNIYDYEKWATEIAGISKARVHATWNGPGSVKVVLLSSEGRAPATEKVSEVASHIESVRPVGADVTVVPCVETAINVTADVVVREGTDIEAVKAAYSDMLTLIFKDTAFVTDTVRYSRLAALILEQEGVVDWQSLTVNGGTSNIILGADAVPVVGAVTFNVAV